MPTVLRLAALAGPIAVTEFMYNPVGEDFDREWIELHNYGDREVDLSGWTLHDNNGPSKEFVFPPGTSMPAGGLLVVARDKPTFEAEWLDGPDGRVIGGLGFQMNNATGDQLVLRDGSGSIAWNLGYPTPTVNDGHAAFLSQPTFGTTDWGDAAVPGVDFSGADPASGTYGYQRNDHTPDPNAYTSTNGDVASPLLFTCDRACPWDIDCDGLVGREDFLAVFIGWGADPGGPPDVDGVAAVGIDDLLAVMAHWGACE